MGGEIAKMSIMLRPSALTSVLAQANTGGVKSTLLFDNQGDLICSAGSWAPSNSNADEDDDLPYSEIAAAVVNSTWLISERSAAAIKVPGGVTNKDGTGSRNKLKFGLFRMKGGLVGVTKVEGTDFMVCSLAEPTCPTAQLRLKVLTVSDYLKEPLSAVKI